MLTPTVNACASRGWPAAFREQSAQGLKGDHVALLAAEGVQQGLAGAQAVHAEQLLPLAICQGYVADVERATPAACHLHKPIMSLASAVMAASMKGSTAAAGHR